MNTKHSKRNPVVSAVLSLALLAGLIVAAPVAAPANGTEAPPTPFNLTTVGHSGGQFSSVETTGTFMLTVQGNALVAYDMS